MSTITDRLEAATASHEAAAARMHALLDAIADLDARFTALEEFRARLIRTNATITVDPGGDGDFETIQEAVDSLEGTVISSTAMVTILLAQGVHTVTAPVVVDHPYGSRIRLKGVQLPTAFPVYGDIAATVASTRTAMRGKLGSILSIEGGQTGILVQRGGLAGIEDLLLDHNGAGSGSPGCLVVMEGVVPVNRVVAMGASLSGAGNTGAGFATTRSGRIEVTNSLVCHCNELVRALDQSVVLLTGSASSQMPLARGQNGIVARSGGLVRARGVTVTECTEYGARVDEGQIVFDEIGSGMNLNANNLGAFGGRIRAIDTFLGPSTGGGYSLVASLGGYIARSGGTGSNTSNITINTAGADGSFVRVI